MKCEELFYYKMQKQLFNIMTDQNRYKEMTNDKLFQLISTEIKEQFTIEDMKLFLLCTRSKSFVPVTDFVNAELASLHLDYEESFPLDVQLEAFQMQGYSELNQLVYIKNDNNITLAILLVKKTALWEQFVRSEYFNPFKQLMARFITKRAIDEKMKYTERKYRNLYNVTEQFNATMEREVILFRVEEMAKGCLPEYTIQIVLSQEGKVNASSYKLVDYSSQNDAAREAYLSGEITSEIDDNKKEILINAPIKGRQGIYGLLKLSAPVESRLNAIQLSSLKMLTETAGSALENALLYDRSHQLIEELQLVNEISHQLNTPMTYEERISYLQKRFLKVFKPTEIAFVFYDESGYSVAKSKTSFFETPEGISYLRYTSSHIKEQQDSLFDAHVKGSVDTFESYSSIIGIPINNEDEITGFVICLHEHPYYFSFESFKLMTSLIGHSSLALANSFLRDRLQELADKDHLTKLYVRRCLDNHIETSLQNNESGVLLLLDIDDFKQINDTYGHDIGDLVLKQIGKKLKKELNSGMAARWGGEEFAIFLPEQAIEKSLRLAEKLVAEIPLETKPSVTVSMGMTAWESDQSVTPIDIFKRTDEALYIAKKNGKNQLRMDGRQISI